MTDAKKPVTPADIKSIEDLRAFLADKPPADALAKPTAEQLKLLKTAGITPERLAFLYSVEEKFTQKSQVDQLYAAGNESESKLKEVLKSLGCPDNLLGEPALRLEKARSQLAEGLSDLDRLQKDPKSNFHQVLMPEMKDAVTNLIKDFRDGQQNPAKIDSRIRLLASEIKDASGFLQDGKDQSAKTALAKIGIEQQELSKYSLTPAQQTAMNLLYNQIHGTPDKSSVRHGGLVSWMSGSHDTDFLVSAEKHAQVGDALIQEITDGIMDLDQKVRNWDVSNKIMLGELWDRYHSLEKDRSLFAGDQGSVERKLQTKIDYMQKWLEWEQAGKPKDDAHKIFLDETGARHLTLAEYTAFAKKAKADAEEARQKAEEEAAQAAAAAALAAANPATAGTAAGGTGGGGSPTPPSSTVTRPPAAPARGYGQLTSDAASGVGDIWNWGNDKVAVEGDDSITQNFNNAGSWIGDFVSTTGSFLKKTFNGLTKGGKGLLGGLVGLFAVPWGLNQILPQIPFLSTIMKIPFMGTIVSMLGMWFGAKGLYKLAYENSDDPIQSQFNGDHNRHVSVGWVDPNTVGQAQSGDQRRAAIAAEGGNPLNKPESEQRTAVAAVPLQTPDGQNVFTFSLNRKKPSSAYNLFTADQQKMVDVFEDLNSKPVFAGTTGGNNHRGNLIVFPALQTGTSDVEVVDHDNSGRVLTFTPRIQPNFLAPVKFKDLAPTGTEGLQPGGPQ